MRPTTLCFPVAADGRLLLGCKKRGFGNGKWNGFGGKLEPGESFRECAVRELYEEVSLLAEPEALEYMGFLDFHFTAAPAADHITYIYFVKTWTGNATESEEMEPRFLRLINCRMTGCGRAIECGCLGLLRENVLKAALFLHPTAKPYSRWK